MNNLILTFSMEDGSITLNRGVIEALGHPKQVQIRLDEENCQLMLRACNLEEDQAVVVQEEMPQVGGRRLLKRISGLAGLERPKCNYLIILGQKWPRGAMHAQNGEQKPPQPDRPP